MKVGVLIVTHGESGPAMLNAVERLMGREALEAMEALTVTPGEPRPGLSERVTEAVRRNDQGSGVLVLCDLFGSTPWRCCCEALAAGRNVEILGGLNLPMLLKVASADRAGTTPADLARMAADTAIKAIRTGESS